MTDSPPPVPVEAGRRRFDAVSIVWLVPLVTLLIAGFIGWQAYVDRGPLIEIRFDTASGIAEGQTELRFRNVPVGVVERVSFTEGLAQVAAFVRVNTEVAPYIDADAEFWIVQPQVTAQGISGLETVLSGVYIEGNWNDTQSEPETVFNGLNEAPLAALERGGLRIELRVVGEATLSERVPIIYRGLTVGQIGRARINRDGSAVFADAVIFEPYDQLITTSTRFWDTSGFSLSFGAAGAEINFGSLASIITGGITFETLVSGAEPVRNGVVFQVYPDEDTARASVFNRPLGTPLNISVVFNENTPGLAVGAPVELGGVRIGEVTNLTGVVDPIRFGDARVRLQTTLSILPSRLGLPGDATHDNALNFLAIQVASGMRARLATAGLFAGGLKIELVTIDDAAPADLDVDAKPFPEFPSTAPAISDLSASAEGILERVTNLPIEELLENAVVFLDTATALAGSEDIRAIPGDVRALLEETRDLVGSEGAQAVPAALAAALNEIETLVAELNAQEMGERVNAALAAVETAAADFGTSVEGIPELIAEITELADHVGELPLDDLTTELTGLVASAEALIDSDEARDLPGSLGDALDELTLVLTELREGGATDNLNQTLASARVAADSVADASRSLPSVIERLNATLAQANATLAGFDARSDFNRDTRAALRAVQDAARDVSSLARAIERRPNSLITGR